MATPRLRQLVLASCVLTFAGCGLEGPAPTAPRAPVAAPRFSRIAVYGPVNVSRDTTAQNETPLAFNPTNPLNLLTGNNDWNYNDGCGVNASFDGGQSWTPTLPSGFIPGITKYTDDPSVPGTGTYDFGGDPAAAFAPNGTAYFACFGYQASPPTRRRSAPPANRAMPDRPADRCSSSTSPTTRRRRTRPRSP